MAKLDKLVAGASAYLDSEEEILSSIVGTYEVKLLGEDTVRTGALIATDRRLVFYAKKLTGYDLESYPYENISSFEQGRNMMGGTVKFFASGNQVSMKWIKSGELEGFTQLVKSRMGKGSSPSASVAAVPDFADQIKKLGDLLADGLLTEEEFQEKKRDLLDRL